MCVGVYVYDIIASLNAIHAVIGRSVMMVAWIWAMMADLGELLGVGVEMRGLGVGDLGRVDNATVVSQRCRWSVVVVFGLSVMVVVMGDGSVVVSAVIVGASVSVMSRLGEFLVVGVEVSGFGVGYLGGVDDATVMSQRGEWSMIWLEGVYVGVVVVPTRSCKDRYCKCREDNLKKG